MTIPILYSFRRCPYAIRARMALAYSDISWEHREILLKNRPKEMIDISPKGTVPVFQLADGTVIDESLDIMKWALSHKDKDGWYVDEIDTQNALIDQNDTTFKKRLDQYKYHVRFPEGSYESYQNDVAEILDQLDSQLLSNSYLLGDSPKLADVALFPFIRQCAHVDINWFSSSFSQLSKWLEHFKSELLFLKIMKKIDVWTSESEGIIFKN